MIKFTKRVLILALAAFFAFGCLLAADKRQLRRELIRLHVVADSDSQEDQEIKLKVRNAVLAYLQPGLAKCKEPEEAKAYIQARLRELTEVANNVLFDAGVGDRAVVTLTEEAFPVRCYDTFRLPSGIYESLRVVIGSGEGHNWWCVVFPSLCLPASAEEFHEEAVTAGLSPSLTDTLAGEEPYTIRFFLLDCLGKIENFFCSD